ncbi:hypothetical protein B0T16DRAFT_442515 [Cercophora newfieldiana]|uniref:Uncharacterized protein n=1 Tax=Cercophora newfieldiana TaxID=92897 RepID=A0AA39YU22_9PEZI|nr:hypothetical protein B0T16DRAFT_442515 [Cercophora newfieldiana]
MNRSGCWTIDEDWHKENEYRCLGFSLRLFQVFPASRLTASILIITPSSLSCLRSSFRVLSTHTLAVQSTTFFPLGCATIKLAALETYPNLAASKPERSDILTAPLSEPLTKRAIAMEHELRNRIALLGPTALRDMQVPLQRIRTYCGDTTSAPRPRYRDTTALFHYPWIDEFLQDNHMRTDEEAFCHSIWVIHSGPSERERFINSLRELHQGILFQWSALYLRNRSWYDRRHTQSVFSNLLSLYCGTYERFPRNEPLSDTEMFEMLVHAARDCHHIETAMTMVTLLLEMVNATDYDWTGVSAHHDWKNLNENALRFRGYLWQNRLEPDGFRCYDGRHLMRHSLDLLTDVVMNPSYW